MPDSTLSTLQQIRTKVRRLTRSPSENLLSTADLDSYINTFILYDFPEHLRLWSLKKTLTFYTAPNIDTYATSNVVTDPLYNFKNENVSFEKPVYAAGYEISVYQDREVFYGIWPRISQILSVGPTGDGVTTNYFGTLLNGPVIQNYVTFNSADTNNNPIVLRDVPISSQLGDLMVPDDNSISWGSINYLTGAFNFNFPTPPGAGAIINSQSVPYNPSRPTSILFFDDYMVIRPIPDQVYPIEMEVYVRPTEMLNATDQPFLAQWAQWISYGAAKKIFEDRMDLDSVQLIMPEFKMQERLVLRTTLQQISKERSRTIYDQSIGINANNNWWNQSY